MKKSIGILFVILFLGLCMMPFFGLFLGRTNVNSEKRELAVMPGLFTDQGLNSDFTKQYDDYFTDNFAFRPDLITMNAFLYADIFGQSVSEQVIVGKEGWLFFEPTVDDYTKTNVLSDNEIYRLYRTLSIQQQYLEGKGIKFIFAAAPNKASIYGEYMPDRYLVVGDQSNFEKLAGVFAEKNFDYVNLHEVLKDGGMQLYHKLDTHWNNVGAMLAYNALLTKVSESENFFLFDTHQDLVPKEEVSWKGDLSEMLYPTANLLDTQYVFDIEKEYTTVRPVKSMEDLTIRTTCPKGNLNLLMFRDSFANALIPIMSNEFASVNYSRATPYDYTQIDDSTDVVIEEIAERNLPNIITQAPILPAFQVDLQETLLPADMETSVKMEDQGDYIRLVGLAVPPEYSQDNNYDIYVRLQSGDKTYTFVTFPILEEGFFSTSSDKANVAFSMLIDKNSLPEGEYTLAAIIYDQSGYRISQVKEAAIPITHNEG